MADMTGELVGISTQTNGLLAAGPVGGVAYDVRIRRAIDAMKLVRGTTPDFDELAKAVGLSRPHFFLQDIAFELGFDSPGNFTRFFARQQGVTPSQYRRNVQFVDG
ncbi:AraC family transcriptional regulator [Caballeronia choica]|uniref:AraC family transcriptional regulator n=1 Tax=Caballeronia choica TaxID=326476 RepID=A0A158FPM6_9BURK|nr:AraC family transcriptional regulator [Caballeronia choica]SAL21593.1 AraC family transcriptional regulator [Caballeronia choica]